MAKQSNKSEERYPQYHQPNLPDCTHFPEDRISEFSYLCKRDTIIPTPTPQVSKDRQIKGIEKAPGKKGKRVVGELRSSQTPMSNCPLLRGCSLMIVRPTVTGRWCGVEFANRWCLKYRKHFYPLVSLVEEGRK